MEKNKIIRILAFILISLTQGIYAQTGINTSDVNTKAALHIEAPENNKGIIIPRLTTEERDKIDVLNTDDGLTIYNIDEDCFNYYNLLEKSWRSVCGKIGRAEFEIANCSNDINVFGQYKSGESVSSKHYITVNVVIKKKGFYHIVGTTDSDNGYYFIASGEFLTTGNFTITVPAMGMPKKAQKDTFKLSLNGIKKNGSAAACTFEINVEDSSKKPAYKMDCNSSKAFGVYKLNEPLTSQNYIAVTLNYGAEAIGSMYDIETDEVDGIKFKGTGKITSTNAQVVKLYGEGVPITTDLKKMVIRSNSSVTVAVCYTNVRIAIPKKKLLSIGTSANLYGYNFSGNAASNKLITTNGNYGTNESSVIAFEGWSAITNGGNNPSPETLRNWLLQEKYDILVLGYSWNMNDLHADIIMEYMMKGGVILAFTESNTGSTRLLRKVFSNNSINVKSGMGAGSIYTYAAVNDKVLNGPFGDIRSLYWGEDASHTSVAYNINRSSIAVYSDSYDKMASTAQNNSNAGGITAFRHNMYNFIWVGDGGFNSNHSGVSNTICPFKLDASNKPTVKAGYGRGTNRVEVNNSKFTANAIAWALEQAENSGINSINR